jgi:hypothetical protein
MGLRATKQKLSGPIAIGLNCAKAFVRGDWRKQNGRYK